MNIHPDEVALYAEAVPQDAHEADADLWHRNVIRHEARRLTQMVNLWKHLDQVTVPLAHPPGIGMPGLSMPSEQVMAYRMGQRSVIEYLAMKAAEEDEKEDGDGSA